jgi:hypothetical protein
MTMVDQQTRGRNIDNEKALPVMEEVPRPRITQSWDWGANVMKISRSPYKSRDAHIRGVMPASIPMDYQELVPTSECRYEN